MSELDPLQKVCVCNFIHENNNRILESQLQKSPEWSFSRSKQNILYLPFYTSRLGCRKDSANGPTLCICLEENDPDWDFRVTQMPRMNYKERDWQSQGWRWMQQLGERLWSLSWVGEQRSLSKGRGMIFIVDDDDDEEIWITRTWWLSRKWGKQIRHCGQKFGFPPSGHIVRLHALSPLPWMKPCD